MKNIQNILNPRTTSFGSNCRATVTNAVNEDIKKYIGLTDTTFQERHSNHKRDFKYQKYCNCTELAKYVWELKEKNIAPIIKWEILSKVYGNPKQNICILCLTDNNYLNKKTELIINADILTNFY